MHHSPDTEPAPIAARAGVVLENIRARRPRIHCITNTVVQNFTANVLLAAGCVPSMTLSPEEIGAFVERSDGLLVNLGTLDRERREAMSMAVEIAAREQVPWVLDPVFVDRSEERSRFARLLIEKQPAAMRLNHAEFAALSGAAISNKTIIAYAKAHRIVLGLSGSTDFVTDGQQMTSIANGHPLMSKVTGAGCAGSALMAAALAVEKDAWLAGLTALLIMGIAGEYAAMTAAGPGSFATALIDAIDQIDGATLVQQARIS